MAAHNDSETSSPRLLDLSPELRNMIYDFVYTTEDEEGGLYIDLLKAEPRSRSLLLTCRQIYDEVKIIYGQSYRRYWDENDFYIRHDGTEGLADFVWSIIRDFNDKDLRHMQRFHIKTEPFDCPNSGGFVELETSLCDTRGKWISTEKTAFSHPMFSEIERLAVYLDGNRSTQLGVGPYGALLARHAQAWTTVSPTIAQQIMVVMGYHYSRMSAWKVFGELG